MERNQLHSDNVKVECQQILAPENVNKDDNELYHNSFNDSFSAQLSNNLRSIFIVIYLCGKWRNFYDTFLFAFKRSHSMPRITFEMTPRSRRKKRKNHVRKAFWRVAIFFISNVLSFGFFQLLVMVTNTHLKIRNSMDRIRK